jgi:hypothetical protein
MLRFAPAIRPQVIQKFGRETVEEEDGWMGAGESRRADTLAAGGPWGRRLGLASPSAGGPA